eukprot:TRINITY_DN10459_c0_g1_i2.p1 TRINITY_DN10459_c0_g1~~TRINITY_DN10459_c0_g1_i2.p1  ORF type:complete len:144 (-),score=35.96 TRINITY_DN10459_c0_g1_i2:105-476(-)
MCIRDSNGAKRNRRNGDRSVDLLLGKFGGELILETDEEDWKSNQSDTNGLSTKFANNHFSNVFPLESGRSEEQGEEGRQNTNTSMRQQSLAKVASADEYASSDPKSPRVRRTRAERLFKKPIS